MYSKILPTFQYASKFLHLKNPKEMRSQPKCLPKYRNRHKYTHRNIYRNGHKFKNNLIIKLFLKNYKIDLDVLGIFVISL